MKKSAIYKIILICFIIFSLPILSLADENFIFPEYTEEYKKWQELPEEERQNYIEPQMFENAEEMSQEEAIQPFSTEADTNELQATSLPTKFTRDDYGDVKDQGFTNACWGYSASTVFDTNYYITNSTRKIFSGLHMDYMTSKNYNTNGFNRTVDSGGNMQIALAYATNGMGIALDSNMPTSNITSSILQNVKTDAKVSDYIQLSNRNEVKNYIYQYGVVSATTYIGDYQYFSSSNLYGNSNLAYCCTDTDLLANHAITLVGWDDNYTNSSFSGKKGAYLVLNSYGSSFGKNGLYYIFYDDVFLQDSLFGVTKTDDIDYDYLYQYDPYGCIAQLGYGTTYAANVFTRQNQSVVEKLTEISVYVPESGEITVYINANGSNVKTTSATTQFTKYIDESGYHTITLDKPVLLENAQFAIGIKYPGVMGIEMQAGTSNSWCYTATSNKGESFISYDGENYTDLQVFLETNYGVKYSNACIKAFTEKGETISYCKINISKNIEQAGSVSGSATVRKGKQLTINASSYNGYRFIGWYVGDTCVSQNTSYTFTVSKDLNLIARFEYVQNIEKYAFDYRYYADHNLDLYKLYGYNEDALRNHWNYYGKAEGRKSSCVLDLQYYLQNNPDLAVFNNDYVAIYNHFVNYGYGEYRKSSPEFDPNFYKKNNGDLSSMTSLQLIVHYVNYGKSELRKANTNYDIVNFLFEGSFYAEMNPDVAKACGYNQEKLKNHWYRYGIAEGRVASFVFDAKYYLKNNKDVANTFGATNYQAAYWHFVNYGFVEGRQGNKVFSVKYYAEKNGDLKKAFGSNDLKILNHFVTIGRNEPRVTSLQFNVVNYYLKNADLKIAYGKNYNMIFKHYLIYGQKENRVCI